MTEGAASQAAAPRPAPDAVGDYGELRRQVRAAGLLDADLGFYRVMTAAIICLWVAGFALLFVWPGPGDVLAVFVFSLVLAQAGFVGHDAGHNQIFEKTRHNRIFGSLIMTLFLGMSFQFWVSKHNRHHSRTNEIGEDPDITDQFFVFSPEQAARRQGLLGWIARNQGTLFFLLSTMATIGFRVDGWRTPLRNLDKPEGRWELAEVIVNAILWFVIPSIVFGPARWLVLFAVVHMIVGVHLTSVFAPNHKGMPLIEGKRPGFLFQQVVTSRNVHGPGAVGGWIVDFLYGGLNYQIEHHLFPTMPRTHLRAAERLVRSACAATSLPHLEVGVITSFRQVLGAMNAAGRGIQPVVIRS